MIMTDDWFDYYSDYSPTHWNYWLDNHPKTKTQYDRQNWLKRVPVIGSWYKDYLEGKDLEEKNAKIMDMYNVEFGDIDYPHSSSLLSNPSMDTVASSAWEFSRNMKRLYR